MSSTNNYQLKKVLIICAKGSIEDIYASLVLANGAVMEGIEAKLFFTFFGLDAISKKRMKKLHTATVGNPSLTMPGGIPFPTFLGIIPGVEAGVSAMMKKIDIEDIKYKKKKDLPLLSQNISIIETGAYSQVFEKFIHFLGIKTLIITDIDSVDENGKKCKVSEGKNTSNTSLKFFFDLKSLLDLKDIQFNDKILKKEIIEESLKWVPNKKGNLCIVFQSEDREYHARSFEDAFISLNINFIMKTLT